MDITYKDAMQRAFDREMQYIVEIWERLKRFLLHARKNGNRFERRFAWKAMHPFRPKKINGRLMALRVMPQ